jgi:hypothetical protein
MPQQLTAPTRPVIRWSYNGKAYSYTVTPEDRIWWARAIWREGAPQIAVGHVLLQRFAYLYSTSGLYKTLTAFLRAYCQPINPAWLPGGKLSEARIKRLLAKGDTSGADNERERAKSRAVYSNTPLSQIPIRYREIADQILSGTTQSPIPGAMHFTTSFAARTDSPTVAKQKAEAYAQKRNLNSVAIPEGYQPGVNWFFSVPGRNPPSVSIGRIALVAMLPLGLIGLIITLLLFGRKK